MLDRVRGGPGLGAAAAETQMVGADCRDIGPEDLDALVLYLRSLKPVPSPN